MNPTRLRDFPAYAEAQRLHAEATARLRAAEDGLHAVESERLKVSDRPAGHAELAAALLSAAGADVERAHRTQAEEVARMRRAQQAATAAIEQAARDFAAVVKAAELPAWGRRAAAVRALLADAMSGIQRLNAADVTAHRQIADRYGIASDDAIRSLQVDTEGMQRLLADLDELIAQNEPRRVAAAA